MTPDEIQARTGIPAKIVRSIAKVESRGRADAIRFEPHLFLRAVPGAPIPYTRGPTGAASHVAAETNRAAFERAFAINPAEAVKATSWGLYQDLGRHLLSAHPGAPAQAVAAFWADPVGVSGDIFVRWVAANPRINAPARAVPVNFKAIAKAYNGCCRHGLLLCTGCDHYASRLEAAYQTDTGVLLTRLSQAAEAAAETASTAVSETVSEYPVPVALGFVFLAGGAAFAWWAYTKRKRVKRNRRRSSRHVRRNSGARVESHPDMRSKAYWVMSDSTTIGLVGELEGLRGWWAAPMAGYNRGYITRMNQKDAVDTVVDEFKMWEREGARAMVR